MACIEMKPELGNEALKALEDRLGAATAFDRFKALFDQVEDVTPVRDVAKAFQRITNVSLYEPGDVVTLSDGRKYEVDEAGRWIRKGSDER